MFDILRFLGTLGRAGLTHQNVTTFKKNKEACTGRGGKMGFGDFFTGPECYVNGKKVKLLTRGGSKKNNRKNRKTRKRRNHTCRKRRSSTYKK